MIVVIVILLQTISGNIINDEEWFDDTLWDIINLHIYKNVDQNVLKH